MSAILLLPLALLLLPPQEKEKELRRGKWKPRDCPPGWTLYDTRSYQAQSELPRETTKLIVDHLEGMVDSYETFRPFPKAQEKFILKIFASRAHYLAYGAPAMSAAYYSRDAKELVCYDTGKIGGKVTRDAKEAAEETRKRLEAEKPPDDAPAWRKEAWPILQELRGRLSHDLLGVLSHEGWHQYFHHYIVSWVDFPSWLDEGLGDFFYRASPNVAKVEEFQNVAPLEVRFPGLRLGLLAGKTAPWKEFLDFTQQRYYADAQTNYAQGWSMTHFLLTHPNPKVRAIIPTYLTVFKDKHRMDLADAAAFRGHDLAGLETEWKEYVAKLRFDDPELQKLLDQAEAILMKHLGAGVDGSR
ncbi:MAG TPA: DUF1570 domain-containing protein [Planctomycetota bacterium]|nr:DUF1570 domain-containing protein [Planctomycetota bacterium]